MKKRIIATVLSIALMMTSVPWTALDVSAASQDQVTESLKASANDTYVSDADTFDSWKNEFSETNTEYAGAVWTDKSVFSFDELGRFSALKKAKAVFEDGELKMETENASPVTVNSVSGDENNIRNNFLVAMSALGSTKEITGYSALPSDTVFVLDVSNSMSDTDLTQMVEATNKAIEKLQNLNRHNRVAVVVYGTDAATLLEIDRYTTTKTATDASGKTYPVYIELNSNYSQIMTARSVKTSAGGNATEIYNSIDFAAIASGIPSRNYGENWGSYYSRIAAYLEANAALSKAEEDLGININWAYAVYDKEGYQTWEEFIRGRVWNAVSNQQGQNQNSATSDVTNSEGDLVTVSVTASGATYIQGGMNTAHDLFKNVDGKVIETGLVQGGTARIPITVLMSDGAPTYGATNYTSATNGNRVLGDGTSNSVSDRLVFPAQLTAAHLSKMMESYYGREALIYTLGLGIEHDEAHRVLNPSDYTSTNLNTWWRNYENTAQNSTISGYRHNNRTITRVEAAIENDEFQSLTHHRYYVDEYFDAANADDLVAAFDEIVEAIILQSKYYPTLVESGKYDFDGYITFEDEIGGYVEVKDIKGMLLGGTLYTGDAFIEAINEPGLFGNASTYTDYGNELVVSISERLGIDQAKATTLLASAWRSTDGQLKTKNFIGWYGDSKGEYLGHWDTNHTAQNYPDGAVYLNKCYLFQGDLSDTYTSLTGADMMHIVVQVHEEIATGHQCVIWKIPASLVPLVTYKVSVEGNKLVDGMEATLTTNHDTVSPISLLYEVGLVDTINEINLAEEVAKTGHVADEHKFISNGKTIGYAFYSNRWGAQHTNDGSGATDIFDNGNMATVSHFVPSKENERYYYTENTIVYVKDGETYKPHTGSVPTGAGYYYPYVVIGAHETSGQTKVHTHYLPIDSTVITNAKALDDGTGRYYIESGVIHKSLEDNITNKKDNETGTLSYATKPHIVDDTQVYDFLGNNGRWIIYSATGLSITKTIDDAAVAAGEKTFEFVVTLTNKTAVSDSVKVSDIAGETITFAKGTDTDGNATITFSIKNGQTAYITGLEAGTTYTVKENHHDEYVVKSATGETVTGSGKHTVVSGTVEQYILDEAEFVNTATTHKGNLVVSKTITHDYGDDYPIPVNNNTVFAVDVEFEGLGWDDGVSQKPFEAAGTVKYKISDNVYGTAAVTGVTVTKGENNNPDKVTAVVVTIDGNTETLAEGEWWLGHDDSFTIKGVPEDVEYIVTENLNNTGFKNVTPNLTTEGEIVGTIISDDTVYADLVNDYEATGATSAGLTAKIKKVLSGREWKSDDSFTFFLQKYTATGWQNVEIDGTPVTLTITGGTDGEYERESTKNAPEIEFTKADIGTNYFRIGEKPGELEGITYDSTYRYYSVTVYDDDMDGDIDVKVENYQGVTVTNQGEDTYLLEATFTNHHAQAVANINLHKTLTNETGINVSMDEFEFEFCEKDGCTKGDECPDKAAHLTLKANANGDLTFPVVYTENEISAKFTWTEEIEVSDGEGGTKKEEVTRTEDDIDPETGSPYTVPEGATKKQVFTYYLWEKAGSVPGMDYDQSVYQADVEVTVTNTSPSNTIKVTGTSVKQIKDKDGNAVANPAPADTATADTAVMNFSNKYELSESDVQQKVPLNKTLAGRDIMAGDFTFDLYATGADFTVTGVAPETITLNTISGNTAETEVLLPRVTKAGTYYYVLKEHVGDNAAITYDNAIYHITVVVDKHATEAKLETKSVTVNKVGGSSVVYDTAQLGNIAAVEFNNKYTIISGTSITVDGDKDITGKTILLDGEFAFGLYDDFVKLKADADGTQAIKTAVSAATSGSFKFDMEYSQTGEYVYFIKEIGSTKDDSFYGGDITTDTAVYRVDVAVTDADGDGKLEAAYTLKLADADGNATGENLAAAKFTNKFEPDKTTAKSVLGVKIYADDKNNAISAGDWQDTFNFAMYQSDKDFLTAGDMVLTQTVPNGKTYAGTYNNGKFDKDVTVGAYTETTADSIDNRQQFGLDLTFTKAGSYYYILKEVPGAESNVHYDTAEYYVTYIVTEAADGSGRLNVTTSVVYGGNTVQSAEFRNYKIRQEVDVQVKLTKKIDNISSVAIPMNTFQFGLYTDKECETKVLDAAGNHLVSYASTNGDASFAFRYDNVTHKIIDGKPYSITYYAKEIIPADADKIAGMTYDESVYKIEITVKVDAEDHDSDGNTKELNGYDVITKVVDKDGNDIAKANQHAESSNEAVFVNKFEIDDAKHVIDGVKVLDGRNLAANDVFEFGLYNAVMPSDETTGWSAGELVGPEYLVNNNGAAFEFPELTYKAEGTHYYVVKETPAATISNVTYDTTEYLVKVVVTNGGKGAFVASDSVVCKLKDGKYTVATGENPLTLTITNVFTPDPIDISIAGTKAMNGDAGAVLNAGDYTFELYKANEHGQKDGAAVATVTNDANGTFEFKGVDALKFTEAGTYYFIVSETMGNDPTISYDRKGYHIRVDVTKDGNGILHEAIEVTNRDAGLGTSELVVTNTYESKNVTVNIPIKKVLTNNTGVGITETVEDFSFGLYNSAGQLISERNPGTDGTNVFTLTYTDKDFTAADFAGTTTYNYTIKEIIPTPKTQGMIYDESVYNVEVALKYEGKDLVATPTITKVGDTGSKTTALFENVYDLGSVTVSIPVTKSFTGRNWTANDVFTVNLYRTTDIQNPAMGTLVDTVDIRQAAGSYANPKVNYTFTNDTVDVENALRFTSVGTYYFAVKEMYPQGANAANNYVVDGVAYDATEYGVVVTVEKEGTGLKATVKPHVLGHSEQTNIQFNNVYAVRDTDKPHVIFEGTKNLTGRDIVDEEFNFELYKATVDNGVWTTEANYYKTSKNEGNDFQFVEEEYSANGTYHYVIKEVPLGHPTMTYDEHQYRVTVVISDDGAGNWNAPDVSIVKVDKNGNVVASGLTMDNVVFNNTYTPFKTPEQNNVPAVITVDKEITEITTGVDLSTKVFSFGMYTDAECTKPLKTDADGFVKADGTVPVTVQVTGEGENTITLHYTDKDVKATPYVYYLKEIEPAQADKVPGMDYSKEVYKVEVLVHFTTVEDSANPPQTITILEAKPVVTAMSTSSVSSQAASGTAVITNKYQLSPATLTLEGNKLLDESEIVKDNFTFVLYKAVVDPAQGIPLTEVWELGAPVDTAYNDSQTGNVTNDFDKFVFDTLTFSHAGSYYYIIEETPGVLGGVTYDADRYQVRIDVAPHATDAKLVAEIAQVERVNYTYDVQGVRKAEIVDLTANSNKENVTDKKIAFKNHYTATGSFSVYAEKVIDKRDITQDDNFIFELYEADSSWTVVPGTAPIATATADGIGGIEFIDVPVSGVEAEIVNGEKVAKIGTHYYVLKEIDNGDTAATAIVYDNNEYHITVNTKDMGNGVLAAGRYDAANDTFVAGEFAVVNKNTGAQLGAAEEITFVNQYITKPVTATISGTKVLEGADIDNYDGNFTFELYQADENWNAVDNTPVDTTSNTGKNFAFAGGAALTFDTAGVYRFIVKEQKGASPVIRYDETPYRVTVTVAEKLEDTDNDGIGDKVVIDNGKAVLEVVNVNTVGGKLEFTNIYSTAEVTLNIKKELTCTNGATHTLGGFEFKVELDGDDSYIATSGNDGTIAVPLTFTEEELDVVNGYAPKTYTFTITEIDTDIEGMTYDDRVYTVEIELYAENGELKTAITQNGHSVNEVTVQFNNKYEGEKDVPDAPVDPGKVVDTGDMSNNILYAGIMVASAACLLAVLLILKKRKEEDEAEA